MKWILIIYKLEVILLLLLNNSCSNCNIGFKGENKHIGIKTGCLAVPYY